MGTSASPERFHAGRSRTDARCPLGPAPPESLRHAFRQSLQVRQGGGREENHRGEEGRPAGTEGRQAQGTRRRSKREVPACRCIGATREGVGVLAGQGRLPRRTSRRGIAMTLVSNAFSSFSQVGAREDLSKEITM